MSSTVATVMGAAAPRGIDARRRHASTASSTVMQLEGSADNLGEGFRELGVDVHSRICHVITAVSLANDEEKANPSYSRLAIASHSSMNCARPPA